MASLRRFAPFVLIAIFAIALAVLYRQLANFHYREVEQYLGTLTHRRIAIALLLTALNYFVLTFYDVLGIRYVKKEVPYPRIGFASFIGYALNNNVGMSGVVGSSLRYRLYTSWGLAAGDVTRVIALSVVTFWLGFCTLSGISFLVAPMAIPSALHIPLTSSVPIGVFMLVPPLAYISLSLKRGEEFRLRRFTFALPQPLLMFAQLFVGTVDWLLAAAVLYTLTPERAKIHFTWFVTAFLFAQCAGLLSNLPGGVGVFEAIIVVLLGKFVPSSALLGALLAFRLVYYLFPLTVAAFLLAGAELVQRRRHVARLVRGVGQSLPFFVPHVLAFTTFVCGAVLLFSGATPSETHRLTWLERALPLQVIELSHLSGSIIGVSLLLLARGLQRRLDGAYVLTVFLLMGGIAASLLKGLDYEEASILAVMLLALLPCHRHFYRKTALLDEPLSGGWILGISLVVISALWLGLFSYKHIEYSSSLWWHFSFRGNAPRFLRATAVTASVLLLFGFRKLLHPATARPPEPNADEIARARAIVASSRDTVASLALLGDKSFMFSESGRSFLMYAVERRSWVVMGDPVGDPAEFADLAWRFREECDRHNGWCVFYEASREYLPLYIDLGLALVKIGEEARVPLSQFSLEGGSKKYLRKTHRKVVADGWQLEVIPVDRVNAILPELRAISDSWLSEKRTREKSFSLGAFDEVYIASTPVAIICRGEEIVAFANLWIGAEKHEVSVDLMRHGDDAPPGVMDFLFLELILWAQREGYAWFNLGMAPLSGLDRRSLGPLWHRLGSLAYLHGENFYNFQGLRQYKEKFDPVWEPKYLATPKGLALPVVVANIAALISGGLRGAVGK